MGVKRSEREANNSPSSEVKHLCVPSLCILGLLYLSPQKSFPWVTGVRRLGMVHERYWLLKGNTAVGREGETLATKTKDARFLVSVLRSWYGIHPRIHCERIG